jgi:hypothetical protein
MNENTETKSLQLLTKWLPPAVAVEGTMYRAPTEEGIESRRVCGLDRLGGTHQLIPQLRRGHPPVFFGKIGSDTALRSVGMRCAVLNCTVASTCLSPRIPTVNKFDFITDETLRTSLEADNTEVMVCFDHEAWKSVHVLVGSIIEALLVDFLVSSGYQPPNKEDILKLDLGKLIDACKSQNALTDKTRELTVVVKTYRNLIHPGRLLRLKEKVDRNSATVARALLGMIVDEISQLKTKQYGYTAEQILSKIEKDPSCVSILPHLFKDTKEHEIERLLLKLIPDRYLIIGSNPEMEIEDWTTLERLAKSFRVSFDEASKEIKIRATQKFVSILKEAGHNTVFAYEDNLFRASDLVYVSATDAAMVRKHLLTRLEEKRTLDQIKALHGIELGITEEEISDLIDSLVKEILYGKYAPLKSKSKDFIVDLWNAAKTPLDEKVLDRLEAWRALLEQEGRLEQLKIVEEIMESIPRLPF